MKLKTNFVRSSTKYLPVVGLFFLMGIVISIICSLILIVDSQQMKNELTALQTGNKLLLLQKNKLLTDNNDDLPSLESLRLLAKKVNNYNFITGARGDSISLLLSRIEKALPDNTLLKNLSHDQKKGELRLAVVSSKAESLTLFLHNLEQDPSFATVMLVRQSKSEKDVNEVQFDLRLTVFGS